MNSVEQAIIIHAHREFPKEACGLILRDEKFGAVAVPCENIHSEPTAFFQIRAEEYLKAKMSGNLIAYYHSHPGADHTFSEADKAISEELVTPMYLYSLQTRIFASYVPDGYRAPLENREYVPLVHDCFNLVRDYYREKLGIELPKIVVTSYEREHGFKDIAPWVEETKCFPVFDPKMHDIILMQVHSKNLPNHVGIYVGEHRLFHQVDGHLSKYDHYAGYWKSKTFRILRHPAVKQND